MTRVNVDAMALVDARFDRLAMLLGLTDGDHARGRILRLWISCVLQSSHVAGRWLVESVFGASGPEALVSSDLAKWASDDHQTLYIRGTTGRIEWYERLRSQSSHAGKVRALGANRSAGQFTSHVDGAQTSALALAPTLPLALALARSKTPKVPTGDPGPNTKQAKRKPSDATPGEIESVRNVLAKLTEHNGINYSRSAEHTRLIVAQLRNGVTEHDLRKVVAYCAMKTFPPDKPELRMYLRPETLFGPRTIDRYLDPARAWFNTLSEDKP